MSNVTSYVCVCVCVFVYVCVLMPFHRMSFFYLQWSQKHTWKCSALMLWNVHNLIYTCQFSPSHFLNYDVLPSKRKYHAGINKLIYIDLGWKSAQNHKPRVTKSSKLIRFLKSKFFHLNQVVEDLHKEDLVVLFETSWRRAPTSFSYRCTVQNLFVLRPPHHGRVGFMGILFFIYFVCHILIQHRTAGRVEEKIVSALLLLSSMHEDWHCTQLWDSYWVLLQSNLSPLPADADCFISRCISLSPAP